MRTLKFNYLIVVLLLLSHAYLQAQKTLYVDNFHVGSVPFSSLQIALDSAQNGDIIMLQGSPNSYGNIAIRNKSVSIIGVGHHPKNQNGLTAKLDEIEFSSSTQNVTFDGLVLNDLNSTSSENLQDITVRNCQIQQSVRLGNQANRWFLYSNIFEKNASIKSLTNTFLNDVNFANNFFYEPQIELLGSNQNIRFGENLFTGNEIGKRAIVFQQTNDILIENNLFYHILSFENKNHESILKNNYSTECDLAFKNDFQTSNINPNFLDYKGGAFEPHYDFRNATKVGLYTGKYSFSMTGEPKNIAQIRTLTVHNQLLSSNNAKLDFESDFLVDAAKSFSQNPSLYYKINNYLEKYDSTDWKKIIEAECFLDTDPGVGKATKLNFTAAAALDVKKMALSFVNTPTQIGEHTLFLRVKNNQNRWSHLQYFAFFIEKTDVSVTLETIPIRDCSPTTPDCFKLIVKNQGTKTIPSQGVDCMIFNKKQTDILPIQIGTIPPNGFAEVIICDKNKILLEQDSVFITLSSDYLNSHDFNPTNQITTIPFVRTDSLLFDVYDIRGILCSESKDGRVEVKVKNGGNLSTNQYQWTYTSPAGIEVKYTHGFHLGLNSLSTGWYTIKAVNPDGCSGSTRFFIPDAKPLRLTLLPSNYNNFQISCKGKNDGEINAIVCGGTGKYTYVWSNQQKVTENSINTKLKAGIYSVSIEDSNYCKTEANITLKEADAIELLTTKKSYNGSDVSCFGKNDGAITAQANGGNGMLTYAWSNGITTQANNNLIAGTYTVSVTDINACLTTKTVIINNPPVVTITKTSTQPTCNAASGTLNGTITITPSGGTGAYTYNWGAGVTTQNRTGLGAGTYTVTVTDANGCTASNTTVLTEPTVVSIAKTSTQPTCNAASGTLNGTITITPSGGTGAYTYNWGAGVTTQNRTGLGSGTYTVTVTDANGCKASNTTTLTEPTVVSIAKTSTQPTCNAASGILNGTITITPSGGTGAYTYNWGAGVTTQNRTGLGAGTYTVTVTDANGCKASNTTVLIEPTAVSITKTSTQPTCNAASGALNGSITITPSGGTGVFTYNWGAGVTTQNRTGLGAGTYTVTVTDANGCTATNTTTLTEPSAIYCYVSNNFSPSCNGYSNGYIYFNFGGGTGTITTSPANLGLAAGLYNFTATDSNGCSATTSAVVTEPTAVSIAKTSTQPKCNAASGTLSGSINITPSGGTGTYTYNWGAGVTTQNRTGLGSGTYTVIVTDANGCTASNTTTLTEPTAVSIAKTSTQPTCNTASGTLNGSINITPSGGAGAFTYLWNNGATTQNRTGLGAGTYTVTVTDVNGCTATNTTILTEPSAVYNYAINIYPPSCNGGNDGSISFNGGGGTGAISIVPLPSGLSVGMYLFTATDANGCTVTTTATMTQPAAVTISKTSTNVSCNGATTGTINITPSGGTGAYTYSWSDGVATQNRTGLAAGTYTVTVFDLYGCQASNTTTLTQSTALTISKTSTNISCTFGTNGTINITPSGGTAPYTYNWDGGVTTQNRTGLAAAIAYTVTVTDANGCTASNTTTLTQPQQLLPDVFVDNNISCNGGSNGALLITVFGGKSPYTYLWSNGQTATIATSITAGTYTVTITDANSCTKMESITITQPTALTISKTSTNPLCNGATTGTINISPSGGTGAYTYNWGGGVTTQNRIGLVAGTYTVTVTDANGCTATNATIITQPTPVYNNFIASYPVTCNGGNNGSVTLNAAGGTGLVTVLPVQTGLPAGLHVFTATDVNGCTATTAATITQPTAITISKTSTNVSCNGGTNGTINITPSGGTGAYTYNWGAGVTTQNRTGLVAGTYTVTVTDANFCTATNTTTLTQPTAITISKTSTRPVCVGDANGTINITPSGGTGAYTYNWSDGTTTTQNRTGLVVDTYTVTVTDANGCTATNTTIFTQPIPPFFTVLTTNHVTCKGGNNGFITMQSGGIGAITHTPNTTGLSAGLIVFTATDGFGCTTTVNVTITEPATAVSIAKTSTNPTCNAGTNGTINISPSGGTGAYTYNCGGGVTTQNRTGLGAGTYTVTVTDANGCTATNATTITQPNAVYNNVVATFPVTCNGGSNGSVTLSAYGGTGLVTVLPVQTGLPAGLHIFTATDANGCTATTAATITQPIAITISKTSTNPTCNAGTNGSINITPSGGTGAYTYNWGAGITTQNRTGLGAGTYTVTITDANGCTAISSTTITEPLAVAIVSHTLVPGCPGFWEIEVGQVNYAVGALTYLWSNGASTIATQVSTLGTYTVTVTDANGCTVSTSQTITIPPGPPISIALAPTYPLCNGQSNGIITTTVTGAAAPISYSWTDGPTTQNRNSVGHGNYILNITDNNGCTAFNSVQIYNPPTLVGYIGVIFPPTCNGGNNGSITINVAGGTGSTTTIPNPSALTSGLHNFTFTDTNGCTATASATVPVTPPITVNTVSTNISPTQTDVFASISNGFAISSYVWNPNNGAGSTISITPLQPYSVTITDTNGCTGVSSGVAAKLAQTNNNNSIIAEKDKSALIAANANAIKNDVLIAPNPASELAKLSFIEPIWAKINVSIFDARGRTIEQKTFDNSNAIEIDLGNYLNGIYLVKIKSEDGQKFVKRLIVQKN